MKLPVAIERNARLIARKIYQNRSDITFFGGMALTMFGTAMFVKATNDIQPALQSHRDAMNVLDNDEKEESRPKDIIKKDRKDITKGTVKTVVKTYAVPFTVSAVGYGLELYSHKELKSDLATASLALNSVTAAYEALKAKMYPDDLADFQGVHIETDEDGNKSVSFDVDHIEKQPFEMLFDASNPNYKESRGANKAYLMQMQQSENYKIEFGSIPWRYAWQVMADLGEKPELVAAVAKKYPKAGWVYGKTEGIDFGLYSQDWATVRFMDEIEYNVLLRFNCVMNIDDYI